MSTRSVIARGTDIEHGVYVHSDGYPEGVGADLKKILTLTFSGDIEAALKVLVDETPQGWSYTDPSNKLSGATGELYGDGEYKEAVPGVGKRYAKGDGDMRQHVTNQEYGYAIFEDGHVEVYDYNGRTPQYDFTISDPEEEE